jgi:SAM-dependent methyltransferase
MDDERNQIIYKLWAPVYDRVMGPFAGKARRRAIELLDLRRGERVLLCGVGTGLDLPHIRADVKIVGIDLSPAMLRKAQQKAAGHSVLLCEMNAQALDFPDSSFDAVILNLILSVVPDGAAAFCEAWRVLRPGGRAVIFDKFISEDGKISALRRGIGKIISLFGTDPNRRLSEIMGDRPDLAIERNEPSLLHGQYRIVLLCKPHCEERFSATKQSRQQNTKFAAEQEIASPRSSTPLRSAQNAAQ